MKRFNIYESDQSSLMSIYDNLSRPRARNVVVVTEAVGDHPLQAVEVITQRPGGVVDSTFTSKRCDVLSDDGDGGMVLNAYTDHKELQISTTKDNCNVKVVGQDGRVEDEFITTIPPRIKGNVLTIININEV